MNVFILDDEKNARENVKYFLSNSHLDIENIREASSVEEAEEVIKDFSPHVMFLDINLDDGLSFDFLIRLPEEKKKCKIVFISAYDDYAIKAFRFNAVDYLLKPIDPRQFEEVLQKLEDQFETHQGQLEQLNDAFSSPRKPPNKLVLKDQQHIHLVNIDEIVLCTSENNYTRFYFQDQPELLISKTLKEFEEILKGHGFFRTHKTTLVNLIHVNKYDRREGGSIEMSNGQTIPLSRFKKDLFMEILDKM